MVAAQFCDCDRLQQLGENIKTLCTMKLPKRNGGTILHVAYLGSHIEYEIKTLAATLFVIDNQMRARFRKGDSVFAHLPEDKTSLVPA